MYKLCGDITYRIVDEKALVINMRTGEATAFDEIGTIFFNLLKERGDHVYIMEYFKSNYIVDDKILEEDIQKFLSHMVCKKIFEVV